MIGTLPKKLNIGGVDYEIRSDYRYCILILQAFSDEKLNDIDKLRVLLNILYTTPIPDGGVEEAYEKGIWFLNCGGTIEKPASHRQLYSWEQDEQMMFSAINKVVGKEIRELEYMHFWTFMGLFNEIEDGTFSTVLSIRSKKYKGKKLESWEQEYYKNNKSIIDIKTTISEEQQEALKDVDILLGIK